MVKLTHIPLAVLFLLVVLGPARADDRDRDRAARVALALAATEPTPPASAPLPGYAEAYRQALAGGEPLVVYVGCSGRHPIERVPNTVVSAAGELAGYGPGTVVVGYPRDGRLYVHATLRCPEHGAPVAKAVEEARKKIAAPPGRAEFAPVPLNWEVRVAPPCASGCACPGGVCPQKCPVVPPR